VRIDRRADEAVTGRSMPGSVRRAIAARSFSAASIAPSMPVSGSSATNSSPPLRPTKSLVRSALASTSPTADSTASPRSWP
jgi:hypothetical protein